MTEDLYTIEKDLLLEGIYRHYGYDLRHYSAAVLKRGLARALAQEGLHSVSAFQDRILRDADCMERLLSILAIRASSIFREPDFFLSFRSKVAPLLRTYPSVRIWIAGCSSGEEVFSVAILLKECGVYERCRIYATEICDTVLRRAKEGSYPLSAVAEYADNYTRSGGSGDFSSYYERRGDRMVFRDALKERVTYAQHNLASDASFNEFNVILCRNVMLYYQRILQDRAHRLFHESLCRFGVLGLGLKDSLDEAVTRDRYEAVADGQRLYRKVL